MALGKCYNLQVLIGMRNIIIVCGCLLFLGCSKESIWVKQTESNFPVVLMKNRDTNKIDLIQFYLCYDIKKNRLGRMWVQGIDYAYPDKEYGYKEADFLDYSFYNDTLEYINQPYYNKKFLSYFITGQYVIKIFKPVDNTPEVQNRFQPYIDKMIQHGKDTLHIASIQQVKKSNPELINNLLTRDLVRIRFFENGEYYFSIYSVEMK